MFKVPAAFMLVMAPHTYAFIASGKNYDIAYPRTTVDTCSKDTTFDKRVSRIVAAG